jgi:hypothetical protein
LCVIGIFRENLNLAHSDNESICWIKCSGSDAVGDTGAYQSRTRILGRCQEFVLDSSGSRNDGILRGASTDFVPPEEAVNGAAHLEQTGTRFVVLPETSLGTLRLKCEAGTDERSDQSE